MSHFIRSLKKVKSVNLPGKINERVRQLKLFEDEVFFFFSLFFCVLFFRSSVLLSQWIHFSRFWIFFFVLEVVHPLQLC